MSTDYLHYLRFTVNKKFVIELVLVNHCKKVLNECPTRMLLHLPTGIYNEICQCDHIYTMLMGLQIRIINIDCILLRREILQ